MKLKDIQVKNAPYTGIFSKDRLTDGRAMYLLITATGKYWRWDYKHGERRRTLALGIYPDVSLVRAREKAQEARVLLADGLDPRSLSDLRPHGYASPV